MVGQTEGRWMGSGPPAGRPECAVPLLLPPHGLKTPHGRLAGQGHPPAVPEGHPPAEPPCDSPPAPPAEGFLIDSQSADAFANAKTKRNYNMKPDLYEQVTQRIIDQLEKGVVEVR